ncbi:flagellar assembly protein FliH [Oceanisphaera sp.]|uniref:flagellar assembly protein FliH n=1 Tax=Oceanisphaera sp. TaxID=1929979 RepID=UPI003A8D1A12
MSRHPYGAKPTRPKRESEPDTEHWAWPDMLQTKAKSPERALKIKPPAEQPESDPEHFTADPEPLTAVSLEAIRQAAYEEGFEQGKQEGITAGREEGRLTGLQQGHEAGLEQGLEQGLAEGREKAEQQSRQWQQLIEQLQTPLAQVDKVVEQSLVTLAQELARNLLKTEATTSPQLLLATVQEAMSALPDTNSDITLYLHPEDLAIIEQHFDEKSRQQRHWQLLSEPSQARGDVRVKTAMSELDVSLARRIDELMANFIKANWARFHDAG